MALIGNAAMTVAHNGTFADPGATAIDSEDGDLSDRITIEGVVDTSAAGTYVLTYSVEDDDGATAQTTRTVVVQSPPPSSPAPAATSSGGGGGVSWMGLLFLVILGCARRMLTRH